MHINQNVVVFEKCKKIVKKANPELTDNQIQEVINFLNLLAQQTVNNFKNINKA